LKIVFCLKKNVRKDTNNSANFGILDIVSAVIIRLNNFKSRLYEKGRYLSFYQVITTLKFIVAGRSFAKSEFDTKISIPPAVYFELIVLVHLFV